tara:strand:+ start:960 stop:1985 length:1026 start_codon:yes stop_codon:yes gene_type:complete
MTKKDNPKDGATPSEGVAVIIENQIAGEKNAKERCINLTQYISKKAWLIIGYILGATLILGANSIRMHYSWSADLDNAHYSFEKSNAKNRDLALKYHGHRQDTENALREQIDILIIENEKSAEEIDGLRSNEKMFRDKMLAAQSERDHLHSDTHELDDKLTKTEAAYKLAGQRVVFLEKENAELKRAKEGMRKRIVSISGTINTLVSQAQKNEWSYLLARETNLICVGLAKDDPSLLKSAEGLQAKRTGKPFDIAEWHNMTHLADVIVKLNSSNCAKWLVSKNGWEGVVAKNLHDYLKTLAAEAKPKPMIINIEGVGAEIEEFWKKVKADMEASGALPAAH